ncbi:MlaD family protein [Paracidovorax wautersii]|uniref:Phospholipid/cholesterol/gamma-HCH transport system substrate-binding protein n=1 Tax=Paracidovorax wautersii TaxID=1177982 RepID=A0A1I2B6N2_9BURK|nr:MlaD family protein [Paracidovorax wautersii]SFE51729.1 phospholipid/cholesterol/gamma-HCH transport system substrate-binding protein [Paracidovorax wautersii]
MENKSHALAAGIFVVVISALLAVMGLWLTRDRTDYTLYELSTKDSVSGLQPEAPVRYKGVAVGKVTRIGFDPQVPGNVLIRIAVNESAPISPTTFATLGYQGVTGLAHVQLDDANAPLKPPAPGQSGLPRLPLKSSPLSQIAEQGPAILAKVQDATERLNKLLGDENQARFAQALDNLAKASASANTLVQRLDNTVVTRLDPALATVPAVAQDARATLQSLRVAGDNAAAAASEVRGAVAKLSATGGPLDQIADGAQSLSAAADRFGRVSLPRLNNAADEAARAARRLGRTASGISDNPQSLIYGNGSALPGPGEAGFVAPTRAAPAQ